ncbi:MAG: Acyl transf 3 protein [Actinomycetota bacterium]|nr:Acyl transf 3 protein [Actinomycetota bacterium]
MAGLVARVVAATGNRDRVLDAVKALALLVVVAGHSLAWHVTPEGTAVNVLEVSRGLIVLTWGFQVLPLFFAAGAVSNAASLQRHGASAFWLHRTRSLTTPVLVYAGFWTLVGLPMTLVSDQAQPAGRFLSQLLWFAGVYLLVVAAAPLTVRWRGRPVLTLGVWLVVIVGVDLTRIGQGPSWLGWLNLLLVWGWLHQLGYCLPALRRASRAAVGLAAVILLAAAVGLAMVGPYSSSLVTVGGDAELSNLAPPSTVLAVYGAAQVMALAALWPTLGRWLSDDRRWAVVALVGARGMGIYLWHIPLVGVAAAVALAVGWAVAPLSGWWWLVHVSVVLVVIPLAWVVAGVAGRVEERIGGFGRIGPLPPVVAALGAGAVVLNISVTGFATWTGSGMLGLPSSALVNVLLLALVWQAAAPKAQLRASGGRGSAGGDGLAGT